MKEENQEFDLCSNDDGEETSQHGRGKNAINVFKSRYRSPTFSNRETNYLLHCIMAEKQYINNGKNDSVARQDRDQAWERVAAMYNKKFTDAPRSIKMLRTKYLNYKKKVRNESSDERRSRTKHLNFDEEIRSAVKVETDDMDASNQSEGSFYEAPSNFEILLTEKESENKDTSSDPLSAVLNGFTNTANQNEMCSKEDPDVVKLKIELLNYQLETAKMERERVKAAVEAEAADRQKKDELLNLQIREAQINVSLAERRLNAQYPLNNVIHNSHYHVP